MDDELGRMTISQTDDNIVITIPKDLMVFSQSLRPDFPLAVHDKEAMGAWMCKCLIRFGGDTEEGVAAFEQFLDKAFIEAYENGETWLDAINIEEDNT